jgi:hypothetical protein
MPTAFAKVWANESDGEHDQRCGNGYTTSGHNDHSSHCGGWIQHSTRVARTWRGKQTRRRCTSICSSGRINYLQSSVGNPCDGANHIKLTQNEGGFAGGTGEPVGVLECSWDNLSSETLKSMSGDAKYTSGGVQSGSVDHTVYEQLLFGNNNLGTANYNSTGFCENAANLETVVDNNGDTCYRKLLSKVNDATLKQYGIDYCASNPSDPKCKCINVARSDFLTFCASNSTLPGCDQINTAVASYENVGVLRTATSLMGNQDCLVPGICSGAQDFKPSTIPGTCQNQIGICDQVQNIEVGRINEAAELDAFQSCDIEFQALREQNESQSGSPSGIPSNIPTSEQQSSDTTSPTGAPTPTYEEGSLASRLDGIRGGLPASLQAYVPVTIDEIKTDQSKQIGVGGTIFLCVMCVMIVLLLLSSSSNGSGGPPFPTRFRRR